MRSLDRKLLRDLSQMKGQALAISLVIAAGVATFVMSLCAYESLERGKDSFYREFRFADVFCAVRRCPRSILPRISEIPGVTTVEARLAYDVMLDLPDMTEPAVGRLISVPDQTPQRLNRVYIRRGRMIEPGRTGEVVVSEMFADAHQFRTGDHIDAVINGRLQQLTIVGVALSPEYVMQIQGGTLLPDKKRFGILWISEQQLEAAFDMSGAFNDVSVALSRDARHEEVLTRLDSILGPYGAIGSTDRSHHASHQYLTDELRQLRTMAFLAPSIFLSVAAFLLNIVLSRIISQQRSEIATLKAFGYSDRETGLHFLNMAMIITLTGTVSGIAAGLWMAENIVELYGEYYKFPNLPMTVDWNAIAIVIVLASAVALLGTWISVRKVILLPPAQAMRPEAPPAYRPTLVERWMPAHWLSQTSRMIMRNVERRPVKSLLSVLGISMAVAVLILGSFSLDAITYLMDFQFRRAQRQDLTVMLTESTEDAAVAEVLSIEGVELAEPMRAVPTRIRAGHRHRRVAVTGLGNDSVLFRLLDVSGTQVAVPHQGVMLSSKLAEILQVKRGDFVSIDVLEGSRPSVQAEVTALVNEYSGTNAYMNRQTLNRLLQESPQANAIFLAVDGNRLDQIYQELKQRPRIASVTIRRAALQSFEETVAENLLVMRSFNIMFAAVIAIGVVYNSARISLAEQSRDLATMRVIGFTRAEVSSLLLGELALFTVVALPCGCLLGYGMAALVTLGLDTEMYRIPLIVNRSTFVFASLVVVAAAVGSGLIVLLRISTLDLIAVLKTRE
ncbi:MAG: FtsX-like permease family protein [Planctomycetaceae bacterium]|nr:FtsX-like permease family protein [Planctomycetaceae bacterium]